MNVLIVGAGAMGGTFAECFTRSRAVAVPSLHVLEKSADRRQQLQQQGYAHVHAAPGDYVLEMDLVILAVKPQDAPEVLGQLAPLLGQQQLVLSIMAGVPIARLAAALPGTTRLLRAMPNLPALVGRGTTGFAAHPSVGRQDIITIQNLLNTTGKSLFFDREEMLDAVTAVSGSGPAYVYFFMDAMMRSAEEMGFSTTQAELLVEETFAGALQLLALHGHSCQQWIARVSSKGGTTEAALRVLADTRVAEDIHEAMMAALRRSRELGQ